MAMAHGPVFDERDAGIGGYPWTVVPVEQRNTYMDALEKASAEGDIVLFTQFLASLVKVNS